LILQDGEQVNGPTFSHFEHVNNVPTFFTAPCLAGLSGIVYLLIGGGVALFGTLRALRLVFLVASRHTTHVSDDDADDESSSRVHDSGPDGSSTIGSPLTGGQGPRRSSSRSSGKCWWLIKSVWQVVWRDWLMDPIKIPQLVGVKFCYELLFIVLAIFGLLRYY
jgi:hypothetical protein